MSRSPLPHQVLGVSPTATARQVRKAYKQLARKVHPDRDPSPEATARFVAVKNAHDEMLQQIKQGGYRVPRGSPAPGRPPPPPPWKGPSAAPPPNRPPPRRPPPRRPPPRSKTEKSPYVTYESPLRSKRRDAPRRARTRPAPNLDALSPTYAFEPSDFLRPALYIFGIGSWLFFMVTLASVLRSLNQAPTDDPRAEEEVEAPEPAGRIDTGPRLRD